MTMLYQGAQCSRKGPGEEQPLQPCASREANTASAASPMTSPIDGHAFAHFHFLGSDNLHFKARLNIEVLRASMCFRRSRMHPRWNRLNTEKPFVPNCLVSSLPSHDNVISDS